MIPCHQYGRSEVSPVFSLLLLAFTQFSTDLNPHADTPVEILHVILLGFVKYFWRDAVARIGADKKPMLMAHLSSFDTSGLNIPPLAGYTLVKYAGSLTGRDFRAIAQAAPFVLHDLGLTDDQLHAWSALSALVSLVWQPDISDINHYLVSLCGSPSK